MGASCHAGRFSRCSVNPRQARSARYSRITILSPERWWGTRSSSRIAFTSGASGTVSIPFSTLPSAQIRSARRAISAGATSSQK